MNGHTPARRSAPDAGTGPAASHEIKHRGDAARYVAAMLAELRQIAGRAGFDRLVTSLDAAYYEAYGVLDAKARETAPRPRAAASEESGEKNLPKTASGVEPKPVEPH